MWVCFKIDHWKTFSENYISQWEFDYGLFANLPRIIVSHDFSPSSLKLRRGILPLLTNTYPNLKTTCHIKLKFFLWTKLLKNLLLAKYPISVAASLMILSLLIYLFKSLVFLKIHVKLWICIYKELFYYTLSYH